MVVARCHRCGAPLHNVPAFCKCGAYVLQEDRPLVAGAAGGESSATITEAFTYVPPPALPGAQLQTEAVPDIEELPYKYGRFVGGSNVIIGFGLLIFGLSQLPNGSLAFLLFIGGGLMVWFGVALFKRARLAMQIARVCYVLAILGYLFQVFGAMLLSQGIAIAPTIGGSVIAVLSFAYFHKRLD